MALLLLGEMHGVGIVQRLLINFQVKLMSLKLLVVITILLLFEMMDQ